MIGRRVRQQLVQGHDVPRNLKDANFKHSIQATRLCFFRVKTQREEEHFRQQKNKSDNNFFCENYTSKKFPSKGLQKDWSYIWVFL